MEQQITDPKELTAQNIWELSEEEAFHITQYIQTNIEKENRPPYMKIIDSAFEFRTISAKRRDMKQSLTLLGFKFFKNENEESNTVTGVFKRKTPNKSFY